MDDTLTNKGEPFCITNVFNFLLLISPILLLFTSIHISIIPMPIVTLLYLMHRKSLRINQAIVILLPYHIADQQTFSNLLIVKYS